MDDQEYKITEEEELAIEESIQKEEDEGNDVNSQGILE